MNIQILRKNTKAIKDFEKREWYEADMEHYGKRPDWQTQLYILRIKEKNKIVGILEMEIQLSVCTIKQLLIAKSHRRKKIATALMHKVEEFAREHGVHKIYLMTGKGWDAEHLYTSLGYEKAGLMPNHFVKRDFVEYHKFI